MLEKYPFMLLKVRYILLLVLAMFFHNKDLLASTPIILSQDLEIENLWSKATIQYEGQSRSDFAQIMNNDRWLATAGERSLTNYIAEAVWLRIEFRNQMNKQQSFVIEQPYPQTDSVDLYLVGLDGLLAKYSGGDSLHDIGSLNGRTFSFLLEFPPGDTTLLIRTKSEGFVNLSYRFSKPETYYARENPVLTYISLQIGALIILMVYNLFLFVSLKSKIYLYYVLYLFFFVNVQLNFSGIGRFFINDDTAFGKLYFNAGLHFCIKMALAFACLFTTQFLNLKTYDRRVYHGLLGLAFAMVILASLSFSIPYIIDSKVSLGLTVLVSSLLLFIGGHYAIRGYKPAYYYTAGWSFLLLGTLITSLRVLGFLPINQFTNWAQITGATLEGAVLSLALGERYNYFQKKAGQDRERYIRDLKDKEQAKAHSYQQLEKIIYPHQLNLIKAGHELETTMPTGSAEAFVICVDTIASSQINPDVARPFLAEFLEKCSLAMLHEYNSQTTVANAFRINEMGDGFLCSIGFPFGVANNSSPAVVAWNLAHNFIKIFHESLIFHGIKASANCSVAIVKGPIEAYFTSAGVRSYNIFGRALILAERYEKVRKQFSDLRGHHDLLVVQEFAALDLPEDLASQLNVYCLKDLGQNVRDDPNAQQFRYRFINSVDLNSGSKTA